MKIALGAARGLAYLHEDCQPCVIHRDFKASNILLEHSFSPKVADFGLARSAPEGQQDYVSTRVMGTFGYLQLPFPPFNYIYTCPNAAAWANLNPFAVTSVVS